MKKTVSILALFAGLSTLASAQQNTVYLLRVPGTDSLTSQHIYYPSFQCATVDSLFPGSNCSQDILTTVHRAVILETDSFILELDKYSAFHFKSKNSNGREIFTEYYMNKNLPVKDNVYITAKANGNTVLLEFFKAGRQQLKGEKLGDKTLHLGDFWAMSNGKFAPSFLKEVKAKTALKQEGKALLLTVPRDAFPRLVALRLGLYRNGKLVKEEAGLKASENVLYINDIPKGKYRYKVFLTYGDVLQEGDITLK